jgi:hypothetical protein
MSMAHPLVVIEGGGSRAPQMLALPPQTAALCVNSIAETANGVIYLCTPLRNAAIKSLFGISAPAEQGALAGAFQTIGGLHAALAFQCVTALMGLRSARETLISMVAVHVIQAVVGIYRACQAAVADRLPKDEPPVWAFLGAGAGPAVGALILGMCSLVAIRV